jgi:hypothetical protein
MKLIHFMRVEDIVVLLVCAFVILIGVAILRVGLYGKYLGRLRLVSYVQKHAQQPSWRHRCITAGLGVVFVLLGVALLVLHLVFLHAKAVLNSR